MLNIEIRDTTTNWLCLVDSETFSSMRKCHCWLHLWNEQMEISQDIKKNKATQFLKTSTALQAMDGWKVEARRLDFYPTTIDWCCAPWKDVPTDKYQCTTIELKRCRKNRKIRNHKWKGIPKFKVENKIKKEILQSFSWDVWGWHRTC